MKTVSGDTNRCGSAYAASLFLPDLDRPRPGVRMMEELWRDHVSEQARCFMSDSDGP